ncbi:uncharacterized protein G2W53_031969 [Senna tora]|uniref:Uncharacterized protein n=1 Tax=Senna tora TaxID=362788 RepID=A0A834W797_9FABA|nr:uncharacterized protein G2W53_031969 [Senna tora]
MAGDPTINRGGRRRWRREKITSG